MATTSLKLPDEIKQRATMAAQKQGITPHAFMVSAIEQAAITAERRAQFVAEATTARSSMLKSGKGYAAGEVHSYLRGRLAGKKPTKPKAKSWRG
jgi:predicted transcriptional regulator